MRTRENRMDRNKKITMMLLYLFYLFHLFYCFICFICYICYICFICLSAFGMWIRYTVYGIRECTYTHNLGTFYLVAVAIYGHQGGCEADVQGMWWLSPSRDPWLFFSIDILNYVSIQHLLDAFFLTSTKT